MQRAAASSPLTNTPTQTPDHHASKRQKIYNSAPTPTSTGTSTPIPAATDDRSPRLPWNTAGETEWVVSVPPPISSPHNRASSDSESDSTWSHTLPRGRQSYGSFKRRKSTSKTNPSDDLSSLSSNSDADTHPLRPIKRPQDREREEAAQGRRLDLIDLSRMEGVSGSAAMTGAGMGKRRDKDARAKGGYKNKGQNGKANGSHKNTGGVQKSKKRKTM
jgi:hypothetical protein